MCASAMGVPSFCDARAPVAYRKQREPNCAAAGRTHFVGRTRAVSRNLWATCLSACCCCCCCCESARETLLTIRIHYHSESLTSCTIHTCAVEQSAQTNWFRVSVLVSFLFSYTSLLLRTLRGFCARHHHNPLFISFSEPLPSASHTQCLPHPKVQLCAANVSV